MGSYAPYVGLVSPKDAIEFTSNVYKKLFSFTMGVLGVVDTTIVGYVVPEGKLNRICYDEGAAAAGDIIEDV